MIKEINDIVIAYKQAQKQGRQSALATVVHVEGSSYRRPGARMLVEDNGSMTGAISGGCLEGDALRKALLAIDQQQNKLVTYDTLNEDDATIGVQLGCNGIVHILFEPIVEDHPNNPLRLLERASSARQDAVLATIFSLHNYRGHQIGTCLFFNGTNSCCDSVSSELHDSLVEDATSVFQNRKSVFKEYPSHQQSAFIEFIPPAISLIVVGAGNDAVPLVKMATVLGWPVTIADGRPTHASRFRFPKAQDVLIGKPNNIVPQLDIDDRTAVVLMTHNYNYDMAMLALLTEQSCNYIGVLGPHKKLERMLVDLAEAGVSVNDDQRSKIYGPTGLDIGAEAAEEIALSIISEIKAVMENRTGSSLRNKQGSIHTIQVDR